MNFKLNKLLAVSGLVVAMAATCVPMVGAECLESRTLGPGVVEYERTYTAPAATTMTTTMRTKVLENAAVIETAPTATTTEKVFEQETERWSGPTMIRRTSMRRHFAPRKRLAHRRIARRSLVAYRAPRVITRTKTVVVEKPVIVEKQVAIEKPVYIDRVVDRVIEKPVLIEKTIEKPVYIEKCIEKPVFIEKQVVQPVLIKEKKHHGLHFGLLRLKLL